MNTTVIYIESLSISIFLLAFFFILNIKSGTPKHFGYLACIYILTAVAAVIDIVWALTDGNPRFRDFSYVINTIYLGIFIVNVCAWFLYCEKFFPFKAFKNLWCKALFFLPALVILALIGTSPITKLIFYIDENNVYCRGDYYMLLSISYAYLVATGVLSLIAAKKAQLSSEKNRFIYFFLFILSPIFLGVFSIIAPPGGMPTMQFSITFSLILVYLQGQDVKITNDSLTKLPNRYRLDHDIQEKIFRNRREHSPFCVMIADINGFKLINDNFGHMQGDTVLKTIADTLDSIANVHQATVYRMGGDEFVFLYDGDVSIADTISREVAQILDNISKDLDYNLSMCFGAAQYKAHMTLTEILSAADKMLYINKDKLRNNNQSESDENN